MNPIARSPVLTQVAKVLALPLLWLLRGYQIFISPFLPSQCRYYPSCSAYAIGCVRNLGIIRGTWWATRRLFRCTPFHRGGIDHIPDSWSNRHDPILHEVRYGS